MFTRRSIRLVAPTGAEAAAVHDGEDGRDGAGAQDVREERAARTGGEAAEPVVMKAALHSTPAPRRWFL